MESYSGLSVFCVSAFTIIMKFNMVTSSRAKSIEISEFTNEPYIFPEITDGNALQPTLDILLSQKHYHEGMKNVYEKMLKKNKDAQYLKNVGAMIFNTNIMINNDIETVQEYITTGAPKDKYKREPWTWASAFSILQSWKAIMELCEKMDGQRLDKLIEAMQKIARLAIREMEGYEKYADMLYNEALKTSTVSVEDSKSSVEDYPVLYT